MGSGFFYVLEDEARILFVDDDPILPVDRPLLATSTSRKLRTNPDRPIPI